MKHSILQNPRPLDFFGPEDYTGGDPADDVQYIMDKQKEWDDAYNSLSFFEKIKYKLGIY